MTTLAHHLRVVEHFQHMLGAYGFRVLDTRDDRVSLAIETGKWKGVSPDVRLVTFDTVEEAMAWMRGIDFHRMYARHGGGPRRALRSAR
jgi:hypothetical protein